MPFRKLRVSFKNNNLHADGDFKKFEEISLLLLLLHLLLLLLLLVLLLLLWCL